MELLLNASWLLLSAGMLAAVAMLARESESRRLSIPQVFVAFICVSILLFPVISATDDFCAAQAAAEDSTVVKRLADASPTMDSCVLGPICSQPALEPNWRAVGIIDTLQAGSPSTVFSFSQEGRAPPAA